MLRWRSGFFSNSYHPITQFGTLLELCIILTIKYLYRYNNIKSGQKINLIDEIKERTMQIDPICGMQVDEKTAQY